MTLSFCSHSILTPTFQFSIERYRNIHGRHIFQVRKILSLSLNNNHRLSPAPVPVGVSCLFPAVLKCPIHHLSVSTSTRVLHVAWSANTPPQMHTLYVLPFSVAPPPPLFVSVLSTLPSYLAISSPSLLTFPYHVFLASRNPAD